MILIRVNENNELTGYHANPEKLDESEKKDGILVENIPSREKRFGKKGVLIYKPETNSVIVEYRDRPLTEAEQLQNVKESLDYMILQNEGLV